MDLDKGKPIGFEQLKCPRAIEIVKYALSDHSPFLTFLRCVRFNELEVVEIELDLEVPRIKEVDIKRKEQIGIICSSDPRMIPEVIPTRGDFPADNLHVMLSERSGSSLCLWDIPKDILRAKYTPYLLIKRIKEWLELTAIGELHQDDQPLEPLFTDGCGRAIIRSETLDQNRQYFVVPHQIDKGPLTLVFFPEGEWTPAEDTSFPNIVLFNVVVNAIQGRAVKSAPKTLSELFTLLTSGGCDILEELQKWFAWGQEKNLLSLSKLFIAVNFPKLDKLGKEAGNEYWGFVTDVTLGELGAEIGSFYKEGNTYHHALAPNIDLDSTQEIRIDPIPITLDVSHDELSKLSGISQLPDDICVIGVGALGSTVVEIACREGQKNITVFDSDIYMPHNKARHVLSAEAIGFPKTHSLFKEINQKLNYRCITNSVYTDIVKEIDDPETFERLRASSLIIDTSASVPVSRALSNVSDLGRCASLFLNPGGTDFVVLLEDKDKEISLADLEAEYYVALQRDANLFNHLNPEQEKQIRYGASCRDLSSTISMSDISVAAGVGWREIREAFVNDAATIKIWGKQSNGELNLSQPRPAWYIDYFTEFDWTVSWSTRLISELKNTRISQLPNETGGVLIAMIDHDQKTIHICEDVAAPPDSLSASSFFTRGKSGLVEKLGAIEKRTMGNLKYVGEWHSHPSGFGADASPTDEKLFQSLLNNFGHNSEPLIMAIVSDSELFWRIGINDITFEMRIEL